MAFEAAAVKLFGLCVGVSSELGFVCSSNEEVCVPPAALFGLLFDDELDELLPIGFGWLLPVFELFVFCSVDYVDFSCFCRFSKEDKKNWLMFLLEMIGQITKFTIQMRIVYYTMGNSQFVNLI